MDFFPLNTVFFSQATKKKRNLGTTLPRGAKILPCRLTQSNSRDVFFLLMATELALQGNVVRKFERNFPDRRVVPALRGPGPRLQADQPSLRPGRLHQDPQRPRRHPGQQARLQAAAAGAPTDAAAGAAGKN